MKRKKIDIIDLFWLSITFLLTLAFFNSPGTHDINEFIQWINNEKSLGFVDGFSANAKMYPPLSMILQTTISRFGISEFYALRIVNSIFLMISFYLIWFLYDNRKVAILFFFAFFVSQTCGYIDIMLFPFLLLACYFLKKEKLELAGLFFALMIMVKYQPIVFMPFILFLFISKKEKGRIQIMWKKVWRFGWAFLFVIMINLVIFKEALVSSFMRAFSFLNVAISPNALNLGWIIQFLTERFWPEKVGGLVDGRTVILWVYPAKIAMFRYIFWIVFFLLFLLSFRIKSSYNTFLKMSLVEYTMYCMFSSGVHENHFSLCLMLAFLLYLDELSNIYYNRLIIFILISNINIVLFYGIIGSGTINNFVIANVLDVSVLFAILNVVSCIIISFKMVKEMCLRNKGIDSCL